MQKPTQEQLEELFPSNLILLGYRGSVAHNMFLPLSDPNSTDDIDLMGIFMAPVEHYIGVKQTKETMEKFIDEWDVVNYEFIKFVKLLLKSNPNVLSLLWLENEFYLNKSQYGEMLLNNKDIFVSKDAYYSFVGYAHGQLKKMESFKREGYMGQKRKALVEEHGFDTKNASHCIRLLKMGIEFLREGKLNVFRRADRNQLLDIKVGKWPIGEVKEYAEALFVDAKNAFENSPLPRYPNEGRANSLVKTIVFDYINERGIFNDKY